MAKRLALETDKRLLWKLFWLMGIKGFRSVHKHKRRLKRGEFFPPFLYMSVINSCNLRCQGCWVDVGAKQSRIEVEAANKTITQAKAMGNSFFGILGGEPFMHKDLMEIFRSHPDAYFQVFTNGHFITDEVAAELHRLGNVTPLISVEGSEIISDQRRGREGVLNQTMEGIKTALRHNLMVGVCTSVCQTNIDDLVNDAWVDRLIEMGVMYCWFHVYRPCGPDANPDLSLSSDQQRRVRQFVVDTRATKPIIVVDAYHDGAGNALCPAVTGFTHHIGPWGDIEPCPIIQLAAETIHDDRPLKDKFNESEFLRDFRHMTAQNTRGCVVMERPDILVQIAEKHGARDTTARGTAIEELKAMQPRRSQYVPGNEIPERNLAYRLAKKFCFSDFGAYDQQAFSQAKWTDPGESPTPAGGQSPSQLPVISSK
ncbi:radical SAM/SPASM domain-containing protein [Rosistilla oblonga]|uniref:radical SAM protein n=1 Tax=Rosistilla oblonga TaxID=2527990 RepID=UPI003A98224A